MSRRSARKRVSNKDMYDCVKRVSNKLNIEIEEVERIISKEYKDYHPQKITHYNFRRYKCQITGKEGWTVEQLREYLEKNGVFLPKTVTKYTLCDQAEKVVDRAWEPKEGIEEEYDVNKLLRLPSEITMHIIMQLPAKDVLHLCTTSKIMKQFCGDFVWHKLMERDFGEYGKKQPFRRGKGLERYKHLFETYHSYYFSKYMHKTFQRCSLASPGTAKCPYADVLEAIFVIPGPDPNEFKLKPEMESGFYVRTVDRTGKKIVYTAIRFDRYKNKEKKDKFALFSSIQYSEEEAIKEGIRVIKDGATVEELKEKLNEARRFYSIIWV